MAAQMAHVRRIEPRAIGWRSFAWNNGVFDMAHRPYTEAVEGVICTPHHLVMVTLSGGAERLEVTAACGHRYSGDDSPGAVSFVPADCERRLRLTGVRSEWASISLSPTLFEHAAFDGADAVPTLDAATFTNGADRFVAALVAEFARLYKADGKLDPSYCDAMSWALAHYLVRHYGRSLTDRQSRFWKLPSWRLRKIADYVEAHIDGDIRIADLAMVVGVSPGYLHRAFRATSGQTPLAFINERRIQRAMQILTREGVSITEAAFRVGFSSPSHFTRTFRRITGLNPSAYQNGARGF